ncbi:MAG: M23 family metallopeptidase [Candidatus Margulisbacteria bacterium]|jgi:murein DD-endopeptidase MepM/ murein hydrolase activator NlpD|nr:M23 family metallopeptidase [Candidatus Margulisiibacteriota bacterium]
MQHQNYFTLVWLGENRRNFNLSYTLTVLSLGLLAVLFGLSLLIWRGLDISALDAYQKTHADNQLLQAKTYLLYQKNRALARHNAELTQEIKLLEALISAENENIFHLNSNYKNVALEETTFGWRVIQYKLKIGERTLCEYSADRLRPREHLALKEKLELVQKNIEKLVQSKQFTPSIKITELADKEYIGLAGDLVVLSVSKKEALNAQIDGREIAERYKKTLLQELKIAKENKLLQETPLLGSVKTVRTNSSLENIFQQLDFCQKFNQNILAQNNTLIAGIYSKAMDFKNNYARTPSIYPLRNIEISSPYGYRVHPVTNATSIHYGLDMVAVPGTKVLATADGRVTYTGWIGGYGIAVQIHHGLGISTLYGHCDSVLVQKGQYVRKGQPVALSGNSGLSNGPHLHYEIRRWNVAIDPTPYLKRDIFTASKEW